MNKRKINKFLPILLSLFFVIGTIFSNFYVKNIVKAEGRTDVVIHKIKMDSVEGWPKTLQPDGTYEGADRTKYNGSRIENIGSYFSSNAVELNGVSFTYWKIESKAIFDEMMTTPTNFATKEQVKAKLSDAEGIVTQATANGSGVIVAGLVDGYYWFIENPETNLENGATISGMAAVPFGLALPVSKADGTKFGVGEQALHVYPKNTITNEPLVDKDFEGHANATTPREDKATVSRFVGDLVPYEIQTIIQPKAKYKTAKWSDQMTEGLTFVNEVPNKLTVQIGGETLQENTDYELVKVGNGFNLSLKESGLTKINDKTDATTVTIKYKALLNSNAVVDIPESNDVTFHYGNNPSHGNTPTPNKPNERGEITVTKTFDGDTFPAGTSVEITLYNAQTGEKVNLGENANPITLNSTTSTHKFTGLDKDTEYKVVETAIEGYTAEYSKGDATGILNIKNWKDGNPKPKTPKEPKVVTGGHKFQKTNEKGEGLSGAVFYVKNSEDKYLALKSKEQQLQDQTEYDNAEKAYREAVKTSASEENIASLKSARDLAYKSVNTQWKWIETKEDAYEVTSSTNGYFKVTGLAHKENYKLEEKTAPQGYAKIKENITFNVAEGSANSATTLESDKLTDVHLTTVKNSKITIPQTGGIGTVIFTLAGLGIMSFAVIAMRRRKEEN